MARGVPARRAAFATLAILPALLLPALGRARENARRTVGPGCESPKPV